MNYKRMVFTRDSHISVFAEQNNTVDHEIHLQGIPKVLEIDFI